MLARLQNDTFQRRLAALGLLLYLSRVLAELGAGRAWPELALVGALGGLLVGYALLRLLPHLGLSQPAWPVLLLWAYVLFPAFDPRVSTAVGLTALLVWLVARLPNPHPRLLDYGVFVAALAVYWLTLPPGVLPEDGGEFQLVAAQLRVAHPPGFSLFTLVGKGFTLLMPYNPMRAMNLFSAVTSALTVMLSGRAARRLSGNAWAGLVAATGLAFVATFWAVGTRASIRPLTAFFGALALDRLVAYRNTRQPKALFGFVLALSLGGTHHPSLAFPAILFGIYLLLIDLPLVVQPRRWATMVGAFAAGLLPWLYLPIRGSMDDTLAPTHLATWEGFWHHALAKGFWGHFFYYRTGPEIADRMLAWLNILLLQWNPVLLGVTVIAALALLWRNWRVFVLLGGATALHVFVSMTYFHPQTVEYLMPSYVTMAVMLGAGVGYLPGLFGHLPGPKRAPNGLFALVTGLALVGSLALFARNWPNFVFLSRDDSTRAYAETVLNEAPQDAVVFANWHWATPMQALQGIDGLRPDVEVVYVFPEGDERYAHTWARHIEASAGERPVVVTDFYPQEYGALPVTFEPLGPAWQVRERPRRDLPPGMTPRDHAFDGDLTLAGVTLPDEKPIAGRTFEVRVAWRVDAPPGQDVTGFLHFTLPDGTVLTGHDVRLPTSRTEAGDVLVERYTLGVPPDAQPGAYRLLAGLYSVSDSGELQSYTSGGEPHVALADLTIAPPEWPAPTAHPRRVAFGNGARLVGSDWEGDSVYLHSIQPDGTPATYRVHASEVGAAIAERIGGGSPRLGPWGVPLGRSAGVPGPRPGERYIPIGDAMVLSRVAATPGGALQPGQPVTVGATFLSTRPLLRDYVVKVEVRASDFSWSDQSDYVPATSALPTLKWLWNWRVVDRHRLRVPPDASTTEAQADLLVYDHFTNLVLPLLSPELARQGISVPIYTWTS